MPILYEFCTFSQTKNNPVGLYLSSEYTDVPLDLRLESSDDFAVRIIV